VRGSVAGRRPAPPAGGLPRSLHGMPEETVPVVLAELLGATASPAGRRGQVPDRPERGRRGAKRGAKRRRRVGEEGSGWGWLWLFVLVEAGVGGGQGCHNPSVAGSTPAPPTCGFPL